MYNFTIAWSWSRLNDFEKCPMMAYWKHYAPKQSRCPYIENAHLKRGKDVHKSLENAILGTPLPPELSHVQPIITGIRNNIANGWWVNAEYKLTFLADYTSCTWFDRHAFLRSILDVMMKKGPNAVIIDWKTGKVNPSSGQLKLFAMSAMTQWEKLYHVDTAFVWTDHNETTREVYERDDLEEITEEFEERVNMIQIANDDNNWIPNPSDFNCKWCACTKAQCPHSRN